MFSFCSFSSATALAHITIMFENSSLLFLLLLNVTCTRYVIERVADIIDNNEIKNQVRQVEEEFGRDAVRLREETSDDFLSKEKLLSMKTDYLPAGILLPKGKIVLQPHYSCYGDPRWFVVLSSTAKTNLQVTKD